MVVACDVTTTFVGAATEFAAQKGATAKQVGLLERRLTRLAETYLADYGVDILDLPGGGAAGGLAGGLAAVGAKLVPGFDVVADHLLLEDRIEGADLVVTGEGFLDAQSFQGKAVGGVVELAAAAGVAAVVVVGEADSTVSVPAGVPVVSLVDSVGRERAIRETAVVVEEVVTRLLALIDPLEHRLHDGLRLRRQFGERPVAVDVDTEVDFGHALGSRPSPTRRATAPGRRRIPRRR